MNDLNPRQLGLVHNKNIAYGDLHSCSSYRRETENTEEGNLFVSDTLTGVYHFPILFIVLGTVQKLRLGQAHLCKID